MRIRDRAPRRRRATVGLVALAACGIVVAGGAAPALAAPWPWPASGPVIRGFEAPASPYATGHRGIDIAIASGSDVRSPASGVVKFAGRIGGAIFVSIDHAAGLESTYSWVSEALVSKGDAVASGARIALSGTGHPDGDVPHLHFGVKRDGIYIDPMSVLATPDVAGVIHLAPLPTAFG